MELEFSGELIHWRGPSPFHFVAVPEDGAIEIEAVSRVVSYGWGVIPVTVHSGETTWTTSLFPRQGGYLVPVKVAVRRAVKVELGDTMDLRLVIEL